jgi:hypothetical protein
MKRPVRVGDVYQVDRFRFEVTAFDLMKRPARAIGVESGPSGAREAAHAIGELAGPAARLLSGGMGQAVEAE